MVKIAVAGGSGNVGQECIDVLLATKKHEILIFTRKDDPIDTTDSSVKWAKTNYEDVNELTNHLQGIDVVLCFFAPVDQEQGVAFQKNLIDASTKAGVKRFAPSEWVTTTTEYTPWYSFKLRIRDYLAEINKDKKVLEYSLFQPGLFANYLTVPYKSAKHLAPLDLMYDFENRRAVLREGGDDDHFNLTTVQDLANVVARAVDYKGEWPVWGGIRGSRVTPKEIVALGEEIRGGPFAIERISNEDLKKGNWTASWLPKFDHPAIPQEAAAQYATTVTIGFTNGIGAGAFDTGDGWNRLLPDYEFTNVRDFLKKEWAGKP